MIITAGGCRAAVRTDEASGAYHGSSVTRRERPAAPETGQAMRVVVEFSRAFGGMNMRALVGARFTPDPYSPVTVFEVPFGGPLTFGSPADCDSELGGPLVAGLPSDFAAASLAGLSGGVDPLPAGVLRVDRAGYDEMGSSERAFRLVGELLADVVYGLLHGKDAAAVLRATVGSW